MKAEEVLMMRSIHPMMLRLRLYRPDGNPLRRRCDQQESALVLLALALILVSVFPAVLMGGTVCENARRDEEARSAASRQVTATLLENAPSSRVSFTEIPAGRPLAMARWMTPAGEDRTAKVPVPALAKAGSTVTVWVGGSGAPALPPTDPVTFQLRGVAVASLIVAATAFAAFAALAGWRRRTYGARYAAWDLAWERADDQWHHPHRP
ncbi:hypothetical protein AB0K18_49630 [Nonomuraea sp. NPDC049421]|uniref:Rv1733c family protein n=1 Tax=Nonomuraea sp. NPDC049421 TaxID=3155275 RepID=UPI00342AB7F2